MKDKKNVMILFLLLMTITLSLGYIGMGLKINTERLLTSVSSKWDVEITNVTSIETQGNCKSENVETDGIKSVMKVKVAEDECKIIYTMNVKNNGTINAKLKEIITSPVSDELLYNIDGLEKNDVLKSGESKLFTVTVTNSKKNEEIIQDLNEEISEEIGKEVDEEIDYLEDNRKDEVVINEEEKEITLVLNFIEN